MQQITIETFLSKLVRDYPLQEEPFKGMISEWCREALKLIDAYDQWERKTLEVTIKDYRTPIPGDFYSFDRSINQNSDAREQGSDLYFGIKEGKLKVDYLAFPTDKKGFILIPDTVEYQDALAYYCVANLCRKRMIIADKELNYETYREKFNNKKFEVRGDINLRKIQSRNKFSEDYHEILRKKGYGRR